jgi:hypothetical protein
MQVGREKSCKDALSDAPGGTQLGWHVAGTLSLSCFRIHGNIALFMTTIKNTSSICAGVNSGCAGPETLDKDQCIL